MKVVKISRVGSLEAMSIAAKALSQGKVLICPTDTVYILMADAANREAVEKIFKIKGREKGKPLPIFVKDIAMTKQLAKVSARQEKILKKYWPGKFTFVLKSKRKLPRETGTEESIGIRIPNHDFVQRILQQTQISLTGTSANISGEPSFYNAQKAIKKFQHRRYRPDIILDAGTLPLSRPSTVIDITKENPAVLRK